MPAGARVILRRTISPQPRGMTNLRGVSALTGGHREGRASRWGIRPLLLSLHRERKAETLSHSYIARGQILDREGFLPQLPLHSSENVYFSELRRLGRCESADEKVLDGGVSNPKNWTQPHLWQAHFFFLA